MSPIHQLLNRTGTRPHNLREPGALAHTINVTLLLLILTVTSLFLVSAGLEVPGVFAGGVQTLYGCNSNGGGPSSFYTLNPSTGAATLVGTSGGMGMDGCSGLRFQPGTGILFAVGVDQSTHNDALFTVNPATGIATLIADTTVAGGTCSFHGISDISFRSDGTLFGLFANPHACIGTINPTTAAITFIGDTGDGCCGNGFAFDVSNVLWHGGGGDPILLTPVIIDTLDQNTAAPTSPVLLTIPSPICTDAAPDALAFSSGGTLYAILNCGLLGSGPTYLVTIDTSTGVVTDVGLTGVDTIMDGIAWSNPSAECVTASTGGLVCFAANAGGFTSLTASPLSSISTPPAPKLTFPYGLFSFTISGLAPGATVTVTVTLPFPLPAGSFSWWKFQSGAWTQLPSASLDSTGIIITLTLTADSIGTINDPGGPAVTPPKLAVSHVPVGGIMLPSLGLTILAPWVMMLSLLGVLSVEAFLVKRRTKRR